MQRILFTLLILLAVAMSTANANGMDYLMYKVALHHLNEYTNDYVLSEVLEAAPSEPRDSLGLLQERPTIFVRSVGDDCHVIDQTWRYWGTVSDVIAPDEAYIEHRNLFQIVGETYWVLVERANCWDRIETYVVSYRSVPEIHHIHVWFDEKGPHDVELAFTNSEGYRVIKGITVDAKSMTRN